jgi:hypothetical protein
MGYTAIDFANPSPEAARKQSALRIGKLMTGDFAQTQ